MPFRIAHWERVKKMDIGVDMKLFNQVDITFDYFCDKRDRILMRRASWPALLGYVSATPWSNIGKVENKGVELGVNWKKEVFKGFHVDFRGNFTYTENKYIDKDEPAYPYVWQTETGKPLSRTTGYIAEGLFRSQEEIDDSPVQDGIGSAKLMPGDIKYRDVNGDGKITEDDKVMISPYGTMPRIQYGLGLNLSYKGFDFGVFFNGSAKRTLMLNGVDPFGSDEGHGDRNLMNFIADNYWSESEQNWDAEYPRLGLTKVQVANNMVPSTYGCGMATSFVSRHWKSVIRSRIAAFLSVATTWRCGVRSSSGTRNSLTILIRYSVRLISAQNLVFNL